MNRLGRMRALISGSGGTVPSVPLAVSASGYRPDLESVAGGLGGEIETTSAGPCIVVRKTYRSRDRYGNRQLHHYPRPAPETLALVGGERNPMPSAWERAVCFDLETTGLSGGAGTVAFLVGLGWFDADGFQTLQYFLPSLAAERRMLDAVATRFADATLVTFNGKSFDVPITEARFAFHRLPSPISGLAHVDLLHPARRLWPRGETRLTNLERDVLGLRREGDVAGAEIPARYVAYLRGADPRLLSPILEHNRLDLVSLGVLTGIACEMARAGVSATRCAEQALGLGRLYDKVGREREAADCYREAARSPSTAQTRAEALRRLARSYRRRGSHAAAADSWRQLLSLSDVPPGVAHEARVALAIHHEHRTRDFEKAVRLAAGALMGERRPSHRQALERRVRRITRKLDRAPRLHVETDVVRTGV